ncbi:hypothetical protein K493DRAFT_310379, partial [Basidiobolus meristosporus CBS 931.73]
MEAHMLSSVLLPDSTFPSEKYCSKPNTRIRKKEDDSTMFKIKHTRNRELQSLAISDTKVQARLSTEPMHKEDENRPPTRFKGREVVLVDPLDESADYWWPAMIVPPTEIDRSMLSRKLERDECLVRYFEDNKFSVCKDCELTPFRPDTHPLNEFSRCSAFLTDPGVLIAMNYLQTGELGKKFMWKLWGKDKEVPPIAMQVDSSTTEQEKNKPKETVSKPHAPQKRHLREQKTPSKKRRRVLYDESESGIDHNVDQPPTTQATKPTPQKSQTHDKRKHSRSQRARSKKNTPVSSRATSEDVTVSDEKLDTMPTEDRKPQPEDIHPIPVKEIVRKMKALRKEYKQIRRAVRRVAKELVIHKAGDGRITRSMMRRKK